MSHRITVHFPPDRDATFYFRVSCWADDTHYPAIDGKGIGTVHDLDHVRETVHIDVRKTRDLGAVLALISKTLPQHFPNGEDEIVRGSEATRR